MDQPDQESMTVDAAAEAIAAMSEPTTDTDLESEEVEEATESEEQSEEEEITDESEEEEEEEEADDAEPEEGEEDTDIESLADLAEALDVPLEELQANLKTKIKVQGEEIEVTLAELSQGYQKDADYRKKTSELAEHRKAFESEAVQRQEQLNQGFQHLGMVMNALQSKIVQAPNPAEMAYLKETDPAQWAVKNAEFQESQQEFQQLNANALQAYQQLQSQQAELAEHRQQAAISAFREKLSTRLQDTSEARMSALSDYLKSSRYGFNDEQIKGIANTMIGAGYWDSFMEIIDKAERFDAQTSKAAETTKKVKKLPKVSKPTKARAKPTVTSVQKLKNRLGKSGSLDDAAALIANL